MFLLKIVDSLLGLKKINTTIPLSFLILNDQQFRQEPWTILNKIEQFLNLEPYFKEENFIKNPLVEQTSDSNLLNFYCFTPNGNNPKCYGNPNKMASMDYRNADFSFRVPDSETEIWSILKKFYEKYNQQLYQFMGQDFGW